MNNIIKGDIGNQVKLVSLGKPSTFNFLVAAGKVKQVLNATIYSDKKLGDKDNLVEIPASIQDPVRSRSGLFWKATGNSLPTLLSDPKKSAFSIDTSANVVSLEEDEQNEDIFSESSQELVLKANKNLFKFKPGNPFVATSTYNPEFWKAFILGAPSPPPPSSSKNEVHSAILFPKDAVARETNKLNANLHIHKQEQSVNVLAFQDRKILNDSILSQQNAAQINLTSQTPFVQQYAPITPILTAHAVVGTENLQFNQNAQAAVKDFTVKANENLQNLSLQQLPQLQVFKEPPKTPPLSFQNIPPTVRPNEIYFDHAFELNVPFDKKLLDKLGAPIGSTFVDVKPTYNFFIEDYETVMKNTNVHEQLLPNMYVFCIELQNENADDKNTIFKQHITLAGHIPDVFVDVTNNKGEKIGEKDKGQYFEKYSRAFGELLRLDPAAEFRLRQKFSTLVTPLENLDLFKDFNEKRELFPMYWDMSFSTDNSTQFAEVLEDSQLSSTFVKDLIEGNIKPKELVIQESIADATEKGKEITRTITSDKKTVRVWDMMEWIQKLSDNPLDSFDPLQAGTFLGLLNNSIDITSNPQFDLFKNLLVMIFVGKVKEIVHNNLRTFDDLQSGKMAYSENFCYRIEKRDASTNEVIQNFYLPNSNKIDILRFIDTQVKYNKQYKYKIYVYQMVLGNKYHYQFDSITDDTAKIHFINSPSLQLVEILFHEFTGRIMDSPPVPPEVDLIPYKGINNQLLFNINSAVGEYKLDPILIEPTDAAIIKTLREAQRVSEKEFLDFKSDDHASAFEIFRLNKRPHKYQDFTGNRIALVQTDINAVSLQSATAASFIDDILPNRKYYYIFRAIDNHGHISNPTQVFQVEIVDADGTIYPLIESVEFETNRDLESQFKTFRKSIKIVPAFAQRIVNEQKSGLIVEGERIKSVLDKTNIHLGLTEEQVWGKRFKIRITSKRTGKKVDLNVRFIHTNVKRFD